MRKIRILGKKITEFNLTKTLFSLFFVFVGAFMLIMACKKEPKDPDPEPEPEYEAHKFDPDATNVTTQWLGETISCQEIDGKLVFQGDIIVIPNQGKAASNPEATLWDEGKVYYYMGNWFKYREDVTAAMEHISSYTHIKFVGLKTPEAREYREKRYINFITKPGESWSYYGMLTPEEIQLSNNKNAQDLSIGWASTGTVIHELGHALGLIHEHSRSDRDVHIMIDTANIDEKYFFNGQPKAWLAYNVFAKLEMGEHSTFLDYGSIMMYYPGAGVEKPNKEVLKKDDGTSYKDEFQEQQLSPPDIDLINKMYPQRVVSPDIIISKTNSKFINDDVYRAVGEVIYAGYPSITEKGFYYGKVNDDLTKVIVPGTNDGSYFFDLEELEPDTVYIVKAYVMQNDEEFFSKKAITFNTPTSPSGTFTDPRDGNGYKWITIGNQVWMAENLKYLPSVVSPNIGWDETPYYYVYNYWGTDVNAAKATDNYNVYGVLYNWSAAMEACPAGWHLPSDAEWTQLTNYLSGVEVAGGKLKETGTAHWLSPNTGATNETGFTALPGGHRIWFPQETIWFYHISSYGSWWSATETGGGSGVYNTAWIHSMGYNHSQAKREEKMKEFGYSVRCVRD